jgi:integrase
MNTLREALQEYVGLRKGLGYKMHSEGLLLPRFVSFMEAHRAEYISARLALEWAQRPTVQPAEWARRLCFVRGFARHRSATDRRTEIPPFGLLPHHSTRARPHPYTEGEIGRLLDAARELPVAWPSTPLRPWVFHALLGLLSVTGMRLSEVLNLELTDVDLDQSVLTIRGASSVSGGLYRSTRPPARSWPITWSGAHGSSLARSPPTCSSRAEAIGSTAATFIEPSTRCRAARACARSARARGRGCMTSGIASPFRR